MRILLIAILMFCTGRVSAQAVAPYDSAQVSVRSFNDGAVKKYKTDRAFRYDKSSDPGRSLWQRFWDWFWEKVGELLKTKERRNTLLIILVVVIIATIVYFVTKSERSHAFGEQGRRSLDYEIGEENIHNISFEDATREAVDSGNYRLAVRLVYLHSLKLLSDSALIEWKPGKTNSAYANELRKHASYHSFNRLTTEFEYAWYGGEEVNSEHYREFESSFHELKNFIEQ